MSADAATVCCRGGEELLVTSGVLRELGVACTLGARHRVPISITTMKVVVTFVQHHCWEAVPLDALRAARNRGLREGEARECTQEAAPWIPLPHTLDLRSWGLPEWASLWLESLPTRQLFPVVKAAEHLRYPPLYAVACAKIAAVSLCTPRECKMMVVGAWSNAAAAAEACGAAETCAPAHLHPLVRRGVERYHYTDFLRDVMLHLSDAAFEAVVAMA